MKRRTWLGWALGLGLVAPTACSTSERSGTGGEEAELEERPVELTGTMTDGCEGKLSEWAQGQTGSCEGRWKYSAYEACEDEKCGCAEYKKCTSWNFGADPVRAQLSFSSTIGVPKKCHFECLPCDVAPTSLGSGAPAPGQSGALPLCQCGSTQVCDPQWADAKNTCKQMRDQKIAEIRQPDDVPHDFDHLIEEVPGSFAFTPLPGSEVNPKATCAFRIYKPKPAERVDSSCGCKTANVCPTNNCTITGPYWSAPGVSLATLSAAVKAQNRLLYTNSDNAPACSTCENYSGEEGANDRYGCLKAFSTEVPVGEGFLLKRTQMLVYEMYGYALGDEAPDSWLDDARALYADTFATPACGVWSPHYLCNAGGPVTGMTGPAAATHRRCLRLQGSHVEPKTVAREFVTCAEELSANVGYYAACYPFDDPGPRADLAAREGLKALWKNQVNVLRDVSAPPSEVGRQVLNFDAWHEANTRLLTGGAQPTAEQSQILAGDLSEALGLFWGALDAHFNATKPVVDKLNETAPSAVELKTALRDALTRGDQGARELVSAAFTPVDAGDGQFVLPAGGEPLLALLGEALAPLSERLDDQSTYHDFACQFRDCLATANASAVVQFYRILSHLGTAAELGATLDATAGDLGQWKPIFRVLNANRARLDAALTAAAAGKGAEGADLDALPPAVRPFFKIMRNARERVARFNATGQFSPAARSLDSGQDQATRQAVIDAINAKLGPFIARKDRYNNDLIALARETLGSMNDATELTRITNLVAQKEQVRANLEADVRGLQNSADQEARRLGDILTSFQQLETGLDQNQLIDVGNSVAFSASGAHARYLGPGGNPNVEALSIHPGIAVVSGQMLQVQASGSWSPTCALRKNVMQVLKPLSPETPPGPVAIDLSDAVTGPEGFSLQWTGSGFHAGSTTTSAGWSFEAGARGEVCVGEDFIGFDANACLFTSARYQHSNTSADSSGNELRTTAAFSKGLRLSNLPFPDAPAGSLLAVVKARTGGALLDVQVVQGPGVMVPVTQDANVYFVVNDRACVFPERPITDRQLTVRANVIVTLKDVAPKVVEAMNVVLKDVRPYEAIYADQGRILPSQISFLRSQAALKLVDKLDDLNPPISTEDLPAPLLTLFNAFVDREIVRVERAVELKAIDRQLALLKLEVEALQAGVLAGGEQSSVRNLLLAHMVRNLDAEVLRAETRALVEQTRDYLLPMLELWYPIYLQSKRNEGAFKNNLTALSESGDLDGDLTALATAAAEVVNSLLHGFLAAPFGNKPQGAELPIVLVSFPRPSVRVPNALTGDFDSHWRIVDGTRSGMVWSAIERREVARLSLTAADLYARSSTQGTLPCSEVTPVIRGIRFLFASTKIGDYMNAGELNGLGRTLGGIAPEQQTFLTELGEAHYILAPGSVYHKFSGSVLYGRDAELRELVDESFTNDDSTRPVGLSPFGTYEIDFRDIDAEWPGSTGLGIDEAEEFVVAMQLDSKAVTSYPPGVAVCVTGN